MLNLRGKQWDRRQLIAAAAPMLAGLVLAAATLLATVPAASAVDGRNRTNLANGGNTDLVVNTNVDIGSITTGQNSGHSVATGDTDNGDVTITVGDVDTTSAMDVSAGDNTLLASANGGDDASALPGGTASDFFVDISPTISPTTTSDATADGGEGGEGGSGGSGDGGAGGAGGNVVIGP